LSNDIDTTGAQPKTSPLLWIMLALLVWGALLALGSYLFGRTLLWPRVAIVLSSAGLFVGTWLLLLANRRRRLRKKASQ
jgi:hypothetical protein